MAMYDYDERVDLHSEENSNNTCNEERLNSINRKIENNSKIINNIVDKILNRYLEDLNNIIETTKKMLDKKDTLSDQDLESLTLKIPIYYYYASGGLEDLGIESESAKNVKEEIFNKIYLEMEGTIQDKTHDAELKTFNERIMESAYQRAYKKLKKKLDGIDMLFSASKKIISKRMQERDIANRELPYHSQQKKKSHEGDII